MLARACFNRAFRRSSIPKKAPRRVTPRGFDRIIRGDSRQIRRNESGSVFDWDPYFGPSPSLSAPGSKVVTTELIMTLSNCTSSGPFDGSTTIAMSVTV